MISTLTADAVLKRAAARSTFSADAFLVISPEKRQYTGTGNDAIGTRVLAMPRIVSRLRKGVLTEDDKYTWS